MANIYSELIYEVHNLSGSEDITLDPAYVWIIRDIDVFFPGPDTQAVVNVITLSSGGTMWSTSQAVVDNPGFASGWRGRQVFYPLAGVATLRVSQGATFNGPDVRISGYRLTPP